MKKMLTFVPLAIGISAALIYIFNVIQFKMIGSAITILEALTKLRLYLYVAIAGFVIYFIIKIIWVIISRRKIEKEKSLDYDYEYESPIDIKEETNKETSEVYNAFEPIYNNEALVKKVELNQTKYIETKECCNCRKEINIEDQYCPKCGADQIKNEKIVSPFVKNVINILEIVILILITYFLLNMLFEFKEKQDPDFKSPFKVSMTK